MRIMSECLLVCNHNWLLLLTLQLDQLIKCSLLKFTSISIRLSLAIVFVDFTIHFIFLPHVHTELRCPVFLKQCLLTQLVNEFCSCLPAVKDVNPRRTCKLRKIV